MLANKNVVHSFLPERVPYPVTLHIPFLQVGLHISKISNYSTKIPQFYIRLFSIWFQILVSMSGVKLSTRLEWWRHVKMGTKVNVLSTTLNWVHIGILRSEWKLLHPKTIMIPFPVLNCPWAEPKCWFSHFHPSKYCSWLLLQAAHFSKFANIAW